MHEHYLSPLLAPGAVALVGASERPGSLGREILANLLAGHYSGKAYAVNPAHSTVLGERCYATLAAIGAPVDLAIIATPPRAMLSVLEDARQAGIRCAVIVPGLGEPERPVGPLARQIKSTAREHGIRLLGPDCLGLMRPGIGLNATFGRTAARRGALALVSQSSAICNALVDWAWSAGIGFSTVLSIGAALDLDVGEVLDYLLYDPETHSILIYLEGVRDARRFVSGLRVCARSKPIVVVKVGRHLSGKQAALSHTGSMVGNDAVFDAVLRRCGAVRVRTYNELFSAGRLLAADRPPSGNRLAIVTNGGGPGVLAADACEDRDVQLAQLGDTTLKALDALLPLNWSHGNPVDVLADADPERLRNCVSAVLKDDGVDGALALFCPQTVTSASAVARALIPVIQTASKPVLTAWLGEHEAHEGRSLVEAAGMPAFASPEAAVAAFGALADYRRAQALLLEAPPPLAFEVRPDLDVAQRILEEALARKRTLLTEAEAKRLLACFAIPTTRTVVTTDVDGALRAAGELGFPVVLKIVSPDISHKSDVDGVRLNIRDDKALEREFASLMTQVKSARPDARIDGVAVQPMVYKRFGREVSVGLTRDTVFGPVVSVGSGGVAVELLADNAVGLPPLSVRLAESMIDGTRMARLLAGYRHIPPARRSAIVDILLRISDIAVSLPWVAELNINPLSVDEQGAVALDARVVIDPACPPLDRRYSHMAIHPYPARLERVERLRDSTALQIRPIRPEDAEMEVAFVSGLSDQSRYLRFFSSTRKLSPRMLARLTQVDYDRELALIALTTDQGSPSMAAVARFAPLPDRRSCEFAVTVAERFHGRGLGHMLMRLLIEAAREAGYASMTGQILAVNAPMVALARHLGFKIIVSAEDRSVLDAELMLTQQP